MNNMLSIQEVEAKARQMRAEAFASSFTGMVGFFAAAPRKIVTSLRAWARQRRAYEELMSLDDRQLRDMGLARSEIPAVIAGTFAPDSFQVEPLAGAADTANTNVRTAAVPRRAA